MPAKRLLLPVAALLLSAACNSEAPKDTASTQTTAPQETGGLAATTPSGPQCFLKALNRDTTRVSLEFDGDSVRGTMDWTPWEKDGTHGTLAGVRTAAGELDLVYDYMIEGSRQTETKIMKLDGNVLRIKEGELEDPANDGNLRYKDVSKATYSEELNVVLCP